MKTCLLSLMLALAGCTAKIPTPSTDPVLSVPEATIPAVTTKPVCACPASASNACPASCPPQFEVYPGCEMPAQTYSKVVYVDPVNGVRTNDGSAPAQAIHDLNEGVQDKKIVSGTRAILMPGVHASILFNEYKSKMLLGTTEWIKFEFQPGASMAKMELGAKLGKFLVTGGKFTGIITLSGSNMVFSDNQITGLDKDKLAMTAAEWLAVPSAGSLNNGPCLSFTRNKIRNVRFGVTASGSGIEANYPANGVKALVKGNDIEGFSGDGLRGLGSDESFVNNRVADGFVGAADGDGNHDDFFQGFALNGAVYQNVLIEGNTMIDSLTDHPLKAGYQGINIFDGLYKNVVVRKNVVIGADYHGISMYGVDGLVIENNTAVSDYKPGGRSFWIAAFNSKTGVAPKNNVIRNNLANHFSNTQLSTNTNNFVIADPHADYVDYDFLAGKFDVHLKPTSAAYGKGAGAL